ncbi:MAG: YggT family protein [Deltaproteobacteria bacterium]|nr:YggT family protein [Deltaproteobacteria bacterium]
MTTSPLGAIGYFAYFFINIYIWIIIIRILLSWFSANQYSPFMTFLRKITDPLLNLARRALRLTYGGVDFSPILLILTLSFLANFIFQACRCLGSGFSPFVLFPLFVICLVNLVFSLVYFLLLILAIRVILSLAKPDPNNMGVRIVYGATEPLLAPLRKWFPRGPGGLDLKALFFIAFLILFNVLVLNNLLAKSQTWVNAYAPTRPAIQLPLEPY